MSRKTIGIVALALLAVSGIYFLIQTPSRSKKSDLVSAISEAETIRVVQHSSEWDLDSEDFQRRSFEYGSSDLSKEHQGLFLSDAKSMGLRIPSPISSMCKIDPHHTIEFVQPDGVKSDLVICFKCGQIVWDIWGFRVFEPGRNYMRVLANAVEREGFSTKQDWRALAKQRSEKSSAGQPKKRRVSIDSPD
ncbi:MAG: hypothetical protein AAF558_14195 [Verrucomicrobiota bacterium]